MATSLDTLRSRLANAERRLWLLERGQDWIMIEAVREQVEKARAALHKAELRALHEMGGQK